MDSLSTPFHLLRIPYFPIIFSSFLILLTLFIHWVNSKTQLKQNLPPGPKPLPVIGNIHQLLGPDLLHHAITKLCSKYGDVVKLQLGELLVVVVSSPESAREVLKTKEISFAQRPTTYVTDITTNNRSNFIFSLYGDYWRQLRKILVVELSSAKRVQSFKKIREEEAWDLIDYIQSNDGKIINLSDKIFALTNNVISRTAFGKKCKDQYDFSSVLGEIASLAAGSNVADVFPSINFLGFVSGIKSKTLKMYKKIDKIMEDIVTERMIERKSGGKREEKDFLDTLLNYMEDNDSGLLLTIDQIKQFTLDIFGAGSETSTTMVEWVMSELIRHPRIMAKAQAEIREALTGKNKIEETDIQGLNYLNLIIKETFRYHPPATLLPREAIEKSEINGYTIPAKTKILVNIYAMGRDPKIWTNPDIFLPERFENSSIDFKGNNFELVPFGSGRRICPGISFSTTKIELTLATLLYHFDWKLPNGTKLEDLDMSETFRMATRRKTSLQVIATTQIPFQR